MSIRYLLPCFILSFSLAACFGDTALDFYFYQDAVKSSFIAELEKEGIHYESEEGAVRVSSSQSIRAKEIYLEVLRARANLFTFYTEAKALKFAELIKVRGGNAEVSLEGDGSYSVLVSGVDYNLAEDALRESAILMRD